jgi:hypothetical protein
MNKIKKLLIQYRGTINELRDLGVIRTGKVIPDYGEYIPKKLVPLKEKELLTYEKLQEIGFDSVIIERVDSKTYTIDFRPSDTYETFIEKNGK